MTTVFVRPAFALVLSVALGVVAWAADHVPSESALPEAAGLGNLPSHWLIAAFLIGAVSRHQLSGPLWATLGLALAVVVYYTAIHLAGDRPGADLSTAARVWLAVALVAGPVFGFAGAAWVRGRPGQPVAVALLAGALVGEALYLLGGLDFSAGFFADAPTTFAALELLAAAFLPFVMLAAPRERVLAMAVSVVLGVVFYFAIRAVIDGVRDALTPF